MMNDEPCTTYAADDTVSRFVAGTLPEPATEEFERHLVGCARCQRETRLAMAVRDGLSAGSRTARPTPLRRPAVITAFALAAGIVAITSMRTLDNSRVRALGAVGTPPAYAGVAVRRDAVQAESLFEEGMQRYSSGRLAEARSLLLEARAEGADSTPIGFFLGAIHLMERDDAAALSEFRLILERPQNAYTAEAHYYAAKSWLRRARSDSALMHLRAAVTLGGPFAANAQALADSITELRR